MNFYIRYIKLWFKRNNESEQYEFKPDKVNVVTGDSSTGKSSMLRIIDYCLFSANSMIVEDVINENTKWYGLSFHLNGHDFVVIRKAPSVEIEEASIYWKEDESEFPDSFTPNMTVGDMTVIMNQLFSVPEATIELKDRNILLSFRHFLILNYLTEDIIATVNTYFDTRFFMNSDFQEVLDSVFRIAIGINDTLEYQLESSLKKKREALNTYRDKGNNAKLRNQRFDAAIDEIWGGLREQGLIYNTSRTSRQQVQSDIIEAFDKFNKTFLNQQAKEEVLKLKEKKAECEKNLSLYASLQKEFERYKLTKEAQKDSLLPIQYIYQHMEEVIQYHDTNLLLEMLNTSLENLKKLMPRMELPSSIEQETKTLQDELDRLNMQIAGLAPCADKATDTDWIIKIRDYQNRYYNLSVPQSVKYTQQEDINRETEIELISSKLDALKARNHATLKDLNDSIYIYYGMQHGISDSYGNDRPVYDIRNRTLMLERSSNEYPIANIGSKSNYMFLHLCFFLGLHDLLISKGCRQVPSFLFIDQPSIPYYADKDVKSNNDKDKLTKAFGLISRFMEKVVEYNGHHFQIILMEHADSSYWLNFKNFETRYKFVDGEGLVPKRIREFSGL